MKLTDVLSDLKKSGQPVVRTADVMALLGIGGEHASKLLSRLSASGHIVRIKRGLWIVDQGLGPSALSGYLTAPFPSYVSLQTALYHHGMISQIPVVTYIASTARAHVYRTPVGVFSVHHVSPSFFFGHEALGGSGARMATPEKALLDFLYLSPARSRLFAALPELEIPRKFSLARARRMIRRVPAGNRRSLLQGRFEELVKETATAG